MTGKILPMPRPTQARKIENMNQWVSVEIVESSSIPRVRKLMPIIGRNL